MLLKLPLICSFAQFRSGNLLSRSGSKTHPKGPPFDYRIFLRYLQNNQAGTKDRNFIFLATGDFEQHKLFWGLKLSPKCGDNFCCSMFVSFFCLHFKDNRTHGNDTVKHSGRGNYPRLSFSSKRKQSKCVY